MRLATRTALAAALAAAVSLAVLAVLFRGSVYEVLRERLDRQLEERAETAPILAAVGERLAVSELGATVEGARVAYPSGTIGVGALPDDPLPPITAPGWETVRADGENWRLYTVEVVDVPGVGDRTLVQLVAPLGSVEATARDQRRSTLLLAVAAVGVCGLIGYGFGAFASRPLSRLRRDASKLATSPATDWRVGTAYGAVEVDEVATVLNHGLDRVATESANRQAALDAARSFAASATHELRTPLTSAMTDLDVAAHASTDASARGEAINDAQGQLRRLTGTLAALRQLADADLADPSWFTEFDLADHIAVLVADEARRHPSAILDVQVVGADATGELRIVGWLDGVRLACSNLVRNALDHARSADGTVRALVTVERTPDAARITVDDAGPGIPQSERARALDRFARGDRSTGTGLGLALVARVAVLHGGSVELGDAPLGGLRVRLTLGQSGVSSAKLRP